jgi:hypothetical protein
MYRALSRLGRIETTYWGDPHPGSEEMAERVTSKGTQKRPFSYFHNAIKYYFLLQDIFNCSRAKV